MHYVTFENFNFPVLLCEDRHFYFGLFEVQHHFKIKCVNVEQCKRYQNKLFIPYISLVILLTANGVPYKRYESLVNSVPNIPDAITTIGDDVKIIKQFVTISPNLL
ncbi:PxORF3 peptide [Plutella xylostella granulovirus]|uniref:ORF3 protein n=1 Tax=Plutella xylostella granulovirus TaxID=98383 RepID=Q9JGU7_9BBAC|nr:PxORF3 peptide [Plutella xylostella granulovirus]AAG27301.1 PxORF3 peptide [Plutella xylostella granulovirus]AMQ35615.1 PxGV-Corf3 protein [Plutella xylostella granulovirus]AMQ35732.1 PxGV-Korf3 protein [Plutella xylostella granulovirus]AMQ35849.1 PxGV-Morf3 protein [Plutella xylostella granulovirus]AMQ35966.1 PxGV-Torf3 protein [Plutella xylostella granulovirus]